MRNQKQASTERKYASYQQTPDLIGSTLNLGIKSIEKPLQNLKQKLTEKQIRLRSRQKISKQNTSVNVNSSVNSPNQESHIINQNCQNVHIHVKDDDQVKRVVYSREASPNNNKGLRKLYVNCQK